MIKKFKTFLTEGSKNTHLEHIEDLILDTGAAGGLHAIETLQSLTKSMSGKTDNKTLVTTKWDGTLALFCGVDPASGRFFVGTKAVFSKNPKLNFTDRDVDNNYGDNPTVGTILKLALRHVSKLGIRTVLQGDILFTKSSIKIANIDGEPTYVFRPNTIVYGVPVSSQLGKVMSSADLGIIFHTSYTGKTLDAMKASFSVDISKLTKTKNVWFDDAGLKDATGIVYLSRLEVTLLNKLLERAKKELGIANPILGQFAGTSVSTHIKTYSNSLIRSGKQLSDKDLDDLIEYISSKYKSDKGREQALFYFKNHREEVRNIFKFQSTIVSVKNIILNKLNTIGSVGTFKETEYGYQVTAPEGFVAVCSETGKVVKLVDRLTFSQMNFSRH